MNVGRVSIFLLVLIVVLPIINAHVGDADHEEIASGDDVQKFQADSIQIVIIASGIIIVLILISLLVKNKPENLKVVLFFSILVITLSATFYVAYMTVTINLTSETKGPVHWHADFGIYKCGEKLDLVDPQGATNRVGTSVFHEHGDDRIHVEGVVIDKRDADLHNFFRVIGGELTNTKLELATNMGMVEVNDGDLCNGKQGKLQGFVYKTEGSKYDQLKLDKLQDYILSPHQLVPPGDCIIIEFGEEKERTENICETYRIAIEKGEIIGS